MVEAWSCWQYLTDAHHLERLQGPDGPGLYEVRDFESGEVIAFDYVAHVTNALSKITLDDSDTLLHRLMHQ